MDFDFHRAGPSCVVLAHGLTGDRSMGGRFDRLRAGLHAAGLSSLAFDFSRPPRLEAHVAELREAVSACGCERAGLFGQSWGALVCMQARPDLPMVLAAPPTGPIDYPEELLRPLREAVPDETLALFARLQPPRLQRPALLVHGDAGWEEQTLLARTRAALGSMPAGTRLEVLQGADHSLRARYDDVIRLTAEFFSAELRLE
ncbi:MAG TPA: alpha/beta hydrolase [Myxococcales bacterium]|nr:alpha/beta hydrolase [Myxococcales bacterium]